MVKASAAAAVGRSERGAVAPSRRRLGVITYLQVVIATLALTILARRAFSPLIFGKDLQQDYLQASALRHHTDVLASLAVLAKLYFPVVGQAAGFPHPSPRMPVLAALTLPFSFLPYDVLVPVWLAVSVCLLMLVGRWLKLSLPASLALAAWPPITTTLDAGQWEILLLLLTLLAWREAAARRDGSAGALLGLAAVIKVYPALLVLPFLVQRRFRVAASAAAVFALGEIGNLLVVGPAGLLEYHLHVLPYVAEYYTGMGVNVSPHGAFLRIFGGSVDVVSLFNAPGLVLPLTAVVSVIALVALARLSPEEGAVAMLLALPNAWGSYGVFALPLIVVLWRKPVARPVLLLATVAASVEFMFLLAWVPVAHFIGTLGPYSSPALVFLGSLEPLGYAGLLFVAWWGRRGGESKGHPALTGRQSSG